MGSRTSPAMASVYVPVAAGGGPPRPRAATPDRHAGNAQATATRHDVWGMSAGTGHGTSGPDGIPPPYAVLTRGGALLQDQDRPGHLAVRAPQRRHRDRAEDLAATPVPRRQLEELTRLVAGDAGQEPPLQPLDAQADVEMQDRLVLDLLGPQAPQVLGAVVPDPDPQL